MDRKRRCSKALMKVFEEASSSRETTPDPFSDDGEYGSDEDYDPPENSGNDDDTGNEDGSEREDSCEYNESSENEDDDSDVSIFDSRLNRDVHSPISESQISMSSEPAAKRPKLDENVDSNADTVSIDSELINNIINDENATENMASPPDPAEMSNHTSPVPSPPIQAIQSSRVPSPLGHVDIEGNLSPSPIPAEMEANNSPRSRSPSTNSIIEDNLAPRTPSPSDLAGMEANHSSQPPPLQPVQAELNDNLQSHPPLPPNCAGMEANHTPHTPLPPPAQVETDENLPPRAPPRPNLTKMEAHNSPHTRSSPIDVPIKTEDIDDINVIHIEIEVENLCQPPSPPTNVELEDNQAPRAPTPPVHAEIEDNHPPSPSSPPIITESSRSSHTPVPLVETDHLPVSPPILEQIEACHSPRKIPSTMETEPSLNANSQSNRVDTEANTSPQASRSTGSLGPSIQPSTSSLQSPSEDIPRPRLSRSRIRNTFDLIRRQRPRTLPNPPRMRQQERTARPRQSRITADRSNNRQRRRQRSPSLPRTWENSTADIPVFEFDETSTGVQFELGPNTSVREVFDKLFSPDIVDFIVTSTNAYGRALCSMNRPTTRNSRRYSYKDTDRNEILKFLGLCLLMGQINSAQKRQLFTYSNVLYFHPIFPYVMSARRFEQILRCLRVSELNAPGKEKIIRFIDVITENFRACYKPDRDLSLDESLLLFRGRLSFRQYIKSKKARYGIKFYEVTSSDGYVLNLIMYAGKDDEDQNEEGKKTEKLVLRLMRPYILKGHNLFMDNYYNSVTLSQKLLELKTHTAGTLRSNRKDNPKDLINKKVKKNQHFWVRKSKVYVSKWVDKRPVLMVTTLNHPKLVEVSNRYGKKKIKPEEVSIYNKQMSGIDRADQMISYYSSPRKCLKWYKKVFFHLLDLAVWNSFFLYKRYCKNNSSKYEFLTFRENLLMSLLNIDPNLKPEMLTKHNKFDNRLGDRSDFVLPQETGNTFGHWPEKIPVRADSKKTSNYMKCRMCTKKKTRRETSLRCKGCDDKPPLCAICFEEWHSLL